MIFIFLIISFVVYVVSETSLIKKSKVWNISRSKMIQHEETGEKILNQPAGSKGILRKATLWVAVTLGLSFVAAYQLIGSDNVGHYEQGVEYWID